MSKRFEDWFFGAVLLSTLVLVGYLFLPYLGALAVALVLAALTHPLYARLQRVLPNDSLASLATVIISTVLLLLPATFIVYQIAGEVSYMAQQLSRDDGSSILDQLGPIEEKVRSFVPAQMDLDVRSLMQDALSAVSRNIGAAFASTAGLLLKLFVALIALYYFLKDGPLYRKKLIHYSPLPDSEDDEVLRKVDMVTHSLIRGRLVIALIQGGLTGIGFVLFGLPNPILWGSVATVTAIIPSVGTAFVTIPAFLYLLLSGQYVAGVLFAVYGLVIIGLVDNLLMPRLVGNSKGVDIHPLLVLLAVLGGLGTFGAAGFLIGPLFLALLVALTHIYSKRIIEANKESPVIE